MRFSVVSGLYSLLCQVLPNHDPILLYCVRAAVDQVCVILPHTAPADSDEKIMPIDTLDPSLLTPEDSLKHYSRPPSSRRTRVSVRAVLKLCSSYMSLLMRVIQVMDLALLPVSIRPSLDSLSAEHESRKKLVFRREIEC